MRNLFQQLMDEVPDDNVPAGGGEVTPTPTTVPGDEPTSELDLSGIIANDEANVDDGETLPVVATKPVDPKPAAPVAPVAPTQATPPVTLTPQAPAVAPVQPVTPVAPVQPVQPALPVEQTPDLSALRTQEQTRLESVYALSEEDKRTVLVEPEKVLPKFAAQLHTSVFESTVQALFAALPQIIEQHTQQRADRESVRNTFYSEFPALKDSKYERDVQTALMTYKHLNPTATREQAIAAAGVQVCLTHRLPLPTKYMDGLQPPAPTVPVMQAPSFAPASPGSASVPLSPGTDNYFAKIAQEDLLDS